MKVKDIKGKVAAKVDKAKAKIEAKCGKVGKCAKALALLVGLAAIASGCATADAPTAQRAQNNHVEDVSIVYNVNVPALASNIVDQISKPVPLTFNITTEIATAAQANDTSGTETMTNTPTQTPTLDVKTDAKFTYGLASDTQGGTDWISSLTDASAKGLATWLKSGKADGTMTVTKTDGTTETVTCADGKCTTSAGDCVTCKECTL